MKIKSLLLLSVAVMALLTSCGSASNEELTNQQWKLTGITDSPIPAYYHDDYVLILDNMGNNDFMISGSCNDMSGKYKLSGKDKIKFTEMGEIESNCSNNIIAIEVLLKQALEGCDSYALVDNQLLLIQDDVPVVVFTATF